MKIFADRHQAGLAYSLRLLAKRLNAEIYFPVGLEWFENHLWDIARPYNNDINTVKQYLLLDSTYRPVDGTPPLNEKVKDKVTHYEIEDPEHGDTLKAITLDQFKEMDIDIIIASIPWHWVKYGLLQKMKPKAKLVCQMGNMFNEVTEFFQKGVIKNLLASTIQFPVPQDVNAVFYHQEQPIVKYVPLEKDVKKIKSFVHLLPNYQLFERYAQVLPEFEWKAYGASCPDGWVNGIRKIYEEMQDSTWGYHWKTGDGYGHIIHGWAISGRPLLVSYQYYKDLLAGKFLIPDETCIDISDLNNLEEVVKKIKEYDVSGKTVEMGLAIRKKWEEIVNYEQETQDIKRFIENLI